MHMGSTREWSVPTVPDSGTAVSSCRGELTWGHCSLQRWLSLQCLRSWDTLTAVPCILGESLIPCREHVLPLASFIVHGLCLLSFKRGMVL